MALTMGQRKAVAKEMVRRYERAPKKEKGAILQELCALTGWSRGHAGRALKDAAGRAWQPPARDPPPQAQGLPG